MERKSAESDNDEQANASSVWSCLYSVMCIMRAGLNFTGILQALSQDEDLLSDTKLQDLPIELLELILIKAVVLEVKGLKLAKCAWKGKADPIISRLRSVCSQWNNILTSDHFPISLHRTLDDIAQVFRLEVLHELSVKTGIHGMATLKGEIFTLRKVCDKSYTVEVYDRDNMEAVKDVIELPESHHVKYMIACNASNCLYVGLLPDSSHNHVSNSLSVLRIWRYAQHRFYKSPWKHQHGRSINMLSISANGGLLTFSLGGWLKPASVAVHDANGYLQLEVFIPLYIGEFKHMGLLQKSNGNLVLSYVGERERRTRLLEITSIGNVVRQYESSHGPLTRLNFADSYDRIMITESKKSGRMELLDSEFNLLGVHNLQQDVGKSNCVYDLYYDRERSVIMRSHYDCQFKRNVLVTFRFTEE